MKPDDLLARHFRLAKPQADALRRLRIDTIGDLLRHFPARYERAGASVRIAELVPGQKVTLFGIVSKMKAKKLWKSRRNATTGTLEDASGKVGLMWFNQPYIASYIPEGSPVKLTGTVAGSAERPYIANPEVEFVPPGTVAEALPAGRHGLFEGDAKENGIYPVYPESRGISSRWFLHAIDRALESGITQTLEDPIPHAILVQYHLPDIAQALVYIHRPEKEGHADAARKRFAFEEIFVLQVARAKERAENEGQTAFAIADAASRAQTFLEQLPYPPTGAQRSAIDDIVRNLEAPHPMARLLEGDVGAGKTLVAAAAAYAIVTTRPRGRESGTLQVAYMAPTEILAEQHFNSFIEYFGHLPINIGLITGSGCKKFPSKVAHGKATSISRSQFLKWVGNGEIAIVIGTHALIQKSVKFQHLALAIVDEQHRFGTRQRAALAQKTNHMRSTRSSRRDAVRGAGKAGSETYKDTATNTLGPRNDEMCSPIAPHFLSMTATPIPRTLALTIYGDLDISVLDELPPGRAKITTKLVKPAARDEAYDRIRKEIAAGRQAYVICPRIEEPDPEKLGALQAKSAKAEAARLKREVFPDASIGLLHGSLKPAEKEAVMREFENGAIDILVATSVVEVGVNVPNATVILIEGAERFGLSQLHQLRGRVMRSAHPPYCFLLPGTSSKLSLDRLRTLEQSSDGFKLAEADLAARGAGDLYGRKQWGVSDIGMEALKNVKLIEAARTEAQRLVTRDPALKLHGALRERVDHVARFHEE